jgi:hypothetical protein
VDEGLLLDLLPALLADFRAAFFLFPCPEGLEMTLEILGDGDAVSRISESLAALGRGEPGADLATVRADLARRRLSGR